MIVEKPIEDLNLKAKSSRDETEEKEKIEEDVDEPVQIISADEFKIHIEKEGSDGFKIKKKGEEGEES